jgi:hypothetical protein
MKFAVIFFSIFLGGCSIPNMESSDLVKLMEHIKSSQASACFWFGGRGGAGGGVITTPVSGGYGSGEILFGRVNSPDTTLVIADGTCSITSGFMSKEVEKE